MLFSVSSSSQRPQNTPKSSCCASSILARSIKYVIRRIDGTKVTNKATKSTEPAISEEILLREAKNRLFKGVPVYITKNNDTFKSVCRSIGIKPQEERFYLQWLEEQHNIGTKPESKRVQGAPLS